MQRPKGVRNLIIINSLLSLWFALNFIASIYSEVIILAVAQSPSLLTFVLAGPALLFRHSAIRALARFFCYLTSYLLCAFILLALSATGLWAPSTLYVLPAVLLVVYMIGVGGYLNQHNVRHYYGSGLQNT